MNKGLSDQTVREALGPAGDGQTNRESLTENPVAGPLARASSVRPRSAPGSSQKLSYSAERYLRYINSGAWKNRRKRYFETYEKRCAFCDARRSIELHHHTCERMGRELDDDLIALCRQHHAAVHSYHLAHPRLTLTQATRAVGAQFDVKIVQRRVRTELTRRQRDKARRQRKQARIAVARAAARALWSPERLAQWEAEQARKKARRERRASEREQRRAQS